MRKSCKSFFLEGPDNLARSSFSGRLPQLQPANQPSQSIQPSRSSQAAKPAKLVSQASQAA